MCVSTDATAQPSATAVIDLTGAPTGAGATAAHATVSGTAEAPPLEVDGDSVTVYGLFAEHTLEELVVWRGENGAVYFYQSELAYDAPPGWDRPGYKVTAQRHTAVGVGVYAYFFGNVSVRTGIAAQNASGFRHAFTHFLDGHGEIRSVVNGAGAPVMAAGQSSYVCRP